MIPHSESVGIGSGAVTVKPPGPFAFPSAVVTVMATCPGDKLGTVTRTVVQLITSTSMPGVGGGKGEISIGESYWKWTSISSAQNPVPVIVIRSPGEDLSGETEVIIGAGGSTVKPPGPPGRVADPSGVVTVMSTGPGGKPGGTVTKIVVSLTTWTSRPATPLNDTWTVPIENPVPVIVIRVPGGAEGSQNAMGQSPPTWTYRPCGERKEPLVFCNLRVVHSTFPRET